MRDLASRLEGRVELTTDAHAAYPEAIREAFADATRPMWITRSHRRTVSWSART